MIYRVLHAMFDFLLAVFIALILWALVRLPEEHKKMEDEYDRKDK